MLSASKTGAAQGPRRPLFRLLTVIALLALLALLAGPFSTRELAAQKAPEWAIPWLAGTKLSKKTIVTKRYGRLQRNEIWDGRKSGDIEHLVNYTLEYLKPDDPKFKNHPQLVKDFNEMRGYALFYKARLDGRNLFFNPPADDAATLEKKNQMLKDLQEAASLGFRNPKEFDGSRELFLLQQDTGEPGKAYKALVAELAEEAEKKLRDGDKKRQDKLFARLAKGTKDHWKPALETVDGKPFWPEGDKPSAIVVTRIHHDGLVKYLPTLEQINKQFGDKVHIGVAFYQLFADDAARTAQSKAWRDGLKTSLPCAVLDRTKFRELRKVLQTQFESGRDAEAAAAPPPPAPKAGKKAPPKKPVESYEIFQPIIVFLKPSGEPVYQTNGVLRDWQLAYAVEKFLSVVQ